MVLDDDRCLICHGGTDYSICVEDGERVERELKSALPALIDYLESRYGAELDAWLDRGVIEGATVHVEQTEETSLAYFIRRIVEHAAGAYGKPEISIRVGTGPVTLDTPRVDVQLPDDYDGWFAAHLETYLRPALVAAFENIPAAPFAATVLGVARGTPPSGYVFDEEEQRTSACQMLDTQTMSRGARNLLLIRNPAEHWFYTDLDPEFALEPIWYEMIGKVPPSLDDSLRAYRRVHLARQARNEDRPTMST
jgi:hypothetical protein